MRPPLGHYTLPETSGLEPGLTGGAPKILSWPGPDQVTDNPFHNLLYAGIRNLGGSVDRASLLNVVRLRYDIVHIHWPDYFLASPHIMIAWLKFVRVVAILTVARIRGARRIWTVHNVRAHDVHHQSLEKVYRRITAFLFDGLIFLSKSSRVALIEQCRELEQLPFLTCPHGHYRPLFENVTHVDSIDIAQVNEWKRPETRLLCAFGLVRTYKGFGDVAHIVAQGVQGLQLLVAGEPRDCTPVQEVISAVRGAPDNVRFIARRLADAELLSIAGLADAVILPYRAITNSGAAILALSLDLPVIVPALPAFRDLQAAVGVEWLYLYDPPISSEQLKGALEWLDAHGGGRPSLERWDWEPIAREHLHFFASIRSAADVKVK